MSGPQATGGRDAGAKRSLSLHLDEFAWESITQECTRLGVSVEDFVSFSVLYYLADIDSGRVARMISRSPYPRPPQ